MATALVRFIDKNDRMADCVWRECDGHVEGTGGRIRDVLMGVLDGTVPFAVRYTAEEVRRGKYPDPTWHEATAVTMLLMHLNPLAVLTVPATERLSIDGRYPDYLYTVFWDLIGNRHISVVRLDNETDGDSVCLYTGLVENFDPEMNEEEAACQM